MAVAPLGLEGETAMPEPEGDMPKHACGSLAAFGAMILIQAGCAGASAPQQSATDGRAVVVVECVLQPGGRLSDCQIISEQPPGMGFGEAALGAAERSRVSLSDNPRARAGEKVRWTIRFRETTPRRP